MACADDDGFLCGRVYDWTGSETAADWASFLLDTPLRILLVVVAALVVNRVLGRLIGRLGRHLNTMARVDRRSVARAEQRTATLSSVLRGLSSAVVWTLASFLVLDELGVNLAPLLAGAGIVGVAVGFGAQALVRDVLAGFFMLVEDQYGVGDHITLEAVSGTVERVTLRVTTLRDADGVRWYIPNGEIHRVGNTSQGQP